MATILSGKEVAASLSARWQQRAAALIRRGITPTLAVLRCGEKPADLSYEAGIEKRAAAMGVQWRSIVLPETVSAEDLLSEMDRLNADPAVHGVLLFRPLPQHLHLREEEICNRLVPSKDVDAMTALSGAMVYGGAGDGFAPCTAQACMEVLRHYGISCEGKRAVVIGRSRVVGKPAAMLLLSQNATVTICHSKTESIAAIARQADILVTAAGLPNSVTAAYTHPGQVILDVSTNRDATGALTGDVAFDEVSAIAGAITPVPGGVGAVTSTVLMRHVIEAAERME